ncbi:MAG: 2Fe-2S iron-sulfur cluster binding domain-containing protein [Planctomycetia bacterium]|nr:2Fe-2S iron-sulfur cluster binding domain-containing protein [Planctomycetia bacterium]
MLITENQIINDIEITINNRRISHSIPTHLRLLDFLRNELNLTGAKEVCAEGECGACTVIMDGKIVNSCLVLAVEADGSEITTIEGIGKENELSELQQAFVDHHSVQCGYCIPGMVLTGEQLLQDNPNATEKEIKQGISGNICRCTGYTKIIDAVSSLTISYTNKHE